jgi:hypothetical protein
MSYEEEDTCHMRRRIHVQNVQVSTLYIDVTRDMY